MISHRLRGCIMAGSAPCPPAGVAMVGPGGATGTGAVKAARSWPGKPPPPDWTVWASRLRSLATASASVMDRPTRSATRPPVIAAPPSAAWAGPAAIAVRAAASGPGGVYAGPNVPPDPPNALTAASAAGWIGASGRPYCPPAAFRAGGR